MKTLGEPVVRLSSRPRCAVPRTELSIWAGVRYCGSRFALFSRCMATTPATCGAATDVPNQVPRGSPTEIFAPGANRSTHAPPLDPLHIESLLSVAATVMMPLGEVE